MAVTSGPCPNCGAGIEFKAGASMSLVCKYCKSVVVRSDRDFRNLGRIADVTFSDAGLALGDSGVFRGRSFTVEGRLVLQHPQGGTWEEYYALFDGRNPAWISEAQGYWQVVTAAAVPAPPLHALAPQMQVPLGNVGIFVVQEKNEGTFLSAEGELPFAASPGTKRVFVDLAAGGGGWASIDYGDGSGATAPQVFVGVQTSFAEFQIKQRGGDRPVATVKTADIKCPNCGAPMPVLSAGAERAACCHCNAISDIKLQRVVAQQQSARAVPGIQLGAVGILPIADPKGVSNAEWTVLGYVERSTGSAGGDDWFGWQEYLLYNPSHGYRWLVFDEGNFLFVTPLSAGDVDARRAPVFVRFGTIHYKLRNTQTARVDYVLGEFYWAVSVGETVRASDYEHGRDVISSEKSQSEVSWSHGAAVPTAMVVKAFGYQPKGSAYGAPTGSPSASNNAKVIGWAVLIIVLVLVFGFSAAACGDCDGGGGVGGGGTGVRGVGGSSSGGFGGK